MAESELTTGQLLGIKEKNGRLVMEYVAGFFGDEPIIKQRLATPQEARRFREDKERGQGSDSARPARKPIKRPAGGLGATLSAKKKPGEPAAAGAPKKRLVRKKRIVAPGAESELPGEAVAAPSSSPAAPAPAVVKSSQPSVSYVPDSGSSNQAFIQKLVDDETDKPNYNPGNFQKALDTISKISCPDMKIYRVGVKEGDSDGYYYTQKEFIARDLLGLPMWKPKPESVEEPEKKEEVEESPENNVPAEVIAEQPATAEPVEAPAE